MTLTTPPRATAPDLAAIAPLNTLAGGSRRRHEARTSDEEIEPRLIGDDSAPDRRVWTVKEPGPPPQTQASGQLESVDLRARRCRLRDDVGNDIGLDDVDNVVEAAGLIGTRVNAVGSATLGARGQLIRLRNAHVEAAEPPRPRAVVRPSGNHRLRHRTGLDRVRLD
jgi:hypothetical protein